LKPNTKFLFGIILIACGWLICFDLYKLIFGIPFFLLGTILVLFSQKSWLVKILVIGIPIILWFVGFKLILNAIEKQRATTVVMKSTDCFVGESLQGIV
jgi:Na+/phosphate symporter